MTPAGEPDGKSDGGEPGKAPASPPPVRPPGWLTWLPLATTPLLWACYHPLDLGWLAYLALVPWMTFLILETRIRRACVMTFATWTSFFVLGLNWLRFTSAIGAVVVSVILALEMFMFAWVVRRWLARRNDAPAWLAMGAAFIGWEYMRIYLMGGFPWFMLGHSQHAYLPLAQAADLGGVPLVGLPAALLNAVVAGLLARRLAGRPPGRDLAFAACGVAALLTAMSAYGIWRLKTLPHVTALRVGLVQGNVPQSVKDAERFGNYNPEKTYLDHRRLTEQVRHESDLILWAETMFPYGITPQFPENERALCRMADRYDRPMLVGVLLTQADGRTYNSAILVDEDGKEKGRYDKRHLVLVAETMPFKTIAPWLGPMIEKITSLKGFGSLDSGEYVPVMEARGKKFGCLICFDSMWPDEAREYALGGADFLACLSNDGWFLETEQLDQILCVTAFRCIENRMGMARCTNTGISAFVGADGRVTEFAVNGKVKSVQGAVSGPVDGKCGSTLYTAWGDWVGKLCLILAGALALAGALPRTAPRT